MDKYWKKFLVYSGPWFSSALVIGVGGYFWIDSIAPKTTFIYTWEGIAMFISICVGIAWVFHGVGFFLVKMSG